MHKDTDHQPPNNDARDQTGVEPQDHHGVADDRLTECGFTREEWRALVAEMIG